MKKSTMIATTAFVLASFPLLAQQPPPSEQPDSPATQQRPATADPAQSNSPAAVPETNSPAAAPQTAAVEMSPVNGALMNKLDSKTAKTGDSVVVQTEASVKTADGTEIPKGSKLVGQVIAVQASTAGENSQVALQFDHVELKDGQNVAIHSQIQSISPASGETASTQPVPMGNGTNQPPAGARSMGDPQAATNDPATPTASSDPAPVAGTLVARTGNIAIRTTSIPGVLVANNSPGQQDPRMAKASSILLGAKKDIQLDGGTRMVLGVSGAGAAAQ